MVNIRQATSEDLKQVADVHFRCFPDSFSTQLGKGQQGSLQQKFYQEYLKDVPELFFVAEDETLPPPERIVCFFMGYYLEKNDYMKEFFNHNLTAIVFRMAFLLITGNRLAWRKIKDRLKKSESFFVVNNDISVIDEQAGDLLSICVLPDYRGSGTAQGLIEKYISTLREKDKKLCLLTVSVDNGRGVRFYERNGFVPYKEAAGVARTYAKIL